jgi:hypothetical protein
MTAAAVACGAPAADRSAGADPGNVAEMTTDDAAGDSLQLEIQAPARVVRGAAVAIVLRVANVSGRDLDLYLRGRTVAFDIVVMDDGGNTVWRRLDGDIIPAIIRLETLRAGNALELRDEWLQVTQHGEPAPAGTYLVRGELLTEGEPLLTDTVRLTLES